VRDVSAGAEAQTFRSLNAGIKQEKRRLLEQAAARVFSEKGLRNATVAEIAKAANVSPGTIYLYFSSREELLYTTILAEIDELEARMQRTLEPDVPADVALRNMMGAYLAFCRERPEGFRMLVAGLEREARERAGDELVAQYNRRALDCLALVRDVLERGMKEGVFRAGDPWELTHALWGAGHGILQIATSQGSERFVGFDIERLYHTTIDTLLDGVRVRPET
jgi:AcrR family transcriptional regulator